MPNEGPLAAALAPLHSRQRQSAPLIRPISQAAFHIHGKDAFALAVREVVTWMRNRNGEIPQNALNGKPFRVSPGAVCPAEAVLIDGEGRRLWAATLEDTREQQSLGRTWVTEITVGEHEGSAAFGARLSQILRGPDSPYQPSRPGCVQQILSQLSAHSDGQLLGDEPTQIGDSHELSPLISLLLNKQRRLPVIALSMTANGDKGVDETGLARRISGLAHIAVLSTEAAWELTSQFGKANSTFLGATRLYRSGFDPMAGSPFDHPLWLVRTNSDAERTGAAQ